MSYTEQDQIKASVYPPRMHGDAFAALAGNQRILASDKANCQIETLWRTGRFYFCLSFF